MKWQDFPILITAVSAVAIADILLKKVALSGNFLTIFRNPLFWSAIALYLLQIIFFSYLFIRGTPLIQVGIFQTVCYALIILAGSIFIIRETINPIQIIGVLLAISGVILLNS